MKISLFFKCIRFDKPAGTFLLWTPTAIALWIAGKGAPQFSIIFIFFLGTFLMRSAGCVINDLTDRDIDHAVKRTALRPLTSGILSVKSAWILSFILLSMAASLLFFLPLACFFWAIFALILTLVYPFTKRFFEAPQCILGLAFMMGIPMATTALGGSVDFTTILQCFITFFWVLAYDTQYALADRVDDEKLSIHSTAILFSKHATNAIFIFQIISHSLWLWLAMMLHFSFIFYPIWGAAFLWFIWQAQLIEQDTKEGTVKAFSLNVFYGLTLWFAVILAFHPQ